MNRTTNNSNSNTYHTGEGRMSSRVECNTAFPSSSTFFVPAVGRGYYKELQALGYIITLKSIWESVGSACNTSVQSAIYIPTQGHDPRYSSGVPSVAGSGHLLMQQLRVTYRPCRLELSALSQGSKSWSWAEYRVSRKVATMGHLQGVTTSVTIVKLFIVEISHDKENYF